MITHAPFTEQELKFLVELLEMDEHQLLHEIHHTDARAMRDELWKRLRTMRRLTERLSSHGTARSERQPALVA